MWNERNYLGQINAVALGNFSFSFVGFLSIEGDLISVEKVGINELKELKQVIENFEITRLENIREYFDTYIE
ncbi:hypothetical protein [Acetivibrio cellulolyticus]|uniref:hypothetical protein n=1 Tax=Acetivibrio cellulolyticus TaxID=35830 RepID=UPI0001E30167|nr:hypothetical protein [Acetivibrio cellulolyticus]